MINEKLLAKASLIMLSRKFFTAYPLSRFKSNLCPAVTLSISYLNKDHIQELDSMNQIQPSQSTIFRRRTSIHYASYLYHHEVFQSHVAKEINDVPALFKKKLVLADIIYFTIKRFTFDGHKNIHLLSDANLDDNKWISLIEIFKKRTKVNKFESTRIR